ncbi:MAG: ATP-binding cassette domain-containing protein [Halioglobus sp.]|nr:ATP-binding cassette domain-containing protein [Halioglobus sp.]
MPKSWRRADVLVASFAINLLALALPIVILQFYDRVIPSQSQGTFAALMTGMAVVVCLDVLIKTLRSIILSWESARFDHKASVAAMDRILQADTQAFDERPAGFYIDRIHALENIQEFYSGQSMLLLIDLPFVVIYLVLIAVIAGPMVAIPLALIGLFFLVSYRTGQRLHKSLATRSDMEDRRQNFVIELLQGIHTAKSMAMESLMLRRYERLQLQSAEGIYDLSKDNSVSQGIGATFSQLAVICFVGVGSIAVVGGDLTMGGLAACTMLTSRALQPGLRAMGVWTQFQSVRLAIGKVNELFSMPREVSGSFTCAQAVRGRLEIKDLEFGYKEDEEPLLRNVSLTVEPGEIIGVSGSNGAGKSTLLALLSGFLHPQSGSITIDGVNLEDFEIEFLRSQIGIVPQQGVIFEGTIMENMTLYREGEAAEQALDLAAKLGLGEIISRLPDGLDTYIGGSAVGQLSEGVKQKIIIVRSLVGNPSIVLFDDANANFDIKNDQNLVSLVSELKGDRTMIVVSHRPSFLRVCDRRFELSNGVLVPLDDRSATGTAAARSNIVSLTGA